MSVIDVLGEIAEKTGKGIEKTADAAGRAIESTEKVASEIKPFVENISELPKRSLESSPKHSFLYSKLEEVKQFNPEQLEAYKNENLKLLKALENDTNYERVESVEGLTDEEKVKLKKETGWSNDIIENISSLKEAEIYSSAKLEEAQINGKPCLIRPDIDWNLKDQFGRTNIERVKQGLAPTDFNGHPLELHHIGQHNDSPLAELTAEEHRGKGNDTILHNKSKVSEIDRSSFGSERIEHWKDRINAEGVNKNE